MNGSGNAHGELHVSGRALYTDDLPEVEGTLFAAIGTSPLAHAEIVSMDLDAVRSAPGVVAVLSSEDIPGPNSFAPDGLDDQIFADGEVLYAGQCLFAVVARTLAEARQAVDFAQVRFEPLEPIVSITQAVAANALLDQPTVLERGDVDDAMARTEHRLAGSLRTGSQDHFYLEGQIAVAVPEESGRVQVICSSQNLSEIQRVVARTLRVDENQISARCGRLGGGFGGKETQPALFACIAAIAARSTGRPVKVRIRRDQDMLITGKRHDFVIDYRAGFDGSGRIRALQMDLSVRCGSSRDLSVPVTIRALLHCDNAYFLENVRLRIRRLKTHTASNTAFRGFGAPQAILAIEHVVDEIARHLGIDATEIRRRNFYASPHRDITHYGMRVEDNLLAPLLDALTERAGYAERLARIDAFNRRNRVLQRGLALIPVKFGISFIQTALNHASALVHVYTDGSVLLHHGGVEMGQGLYTKMIQVAAREFGIGPGRVRCIGTDTGIVPNTAPTAASVSSDLNGKAVQAAVREIRSRLIGHLVESAGAVADQVEFADGQVHYGNESITFEALISSAYDARISLSATGHYKTPDVHFDPETLTGHPFFYFVYGAALSEVVIDTLTGEHRIERVDLLQDAGQSLNPDVDRGQIEGAFLQGVGWLTSEELVWSDAGVLQTVGPSTYKIPTAYDWPRHFSLDFVDFGQGPKDTIFHSKGVGEPPLVLAVSVFLAIKDAIARARAGRKRESTGAKVSASSTAAGCVGHTLDAPATPERVLLALSRPDH